MNRIIKFRVWDTYNLKMVYDPYYFRPSNEPICEDARFNTPMVYAENWQDVDDGIWRPCNLMQYTGFTNIDGADLDWWEGDIIGFKGDRSLFAIMFKNGAFRAAYKGWNKKDEYPIIDYFHRYNGVRKGNIFQNPGLFPTSKIRF